MNLPTVADAREHLNLAASSAELERALAASVAVVEGLGVGPLTPRSITDVVMHGGGPVVRFRTAPVISLTSLGAVTEVGEPAQTFTSSSFVLDGPAGVATWIGAHRLPYGWLRVEYVAGRPVGELPADLHQAVLEQVRHVWESQRGVAPGRLGVDTVAAGAQRGFTVPRRVEQLAAPYMLASQVA